MLQFLCDVLLLSEYCMYVYGNAVCMETTQMHNVSDIIGLLRNIFHMIHVIHF